MNGQAHKHIHVLLEQSLCHFGNMWEKKLLLVVLQVDIASSLYPYHQGYMYIKYRFMLTMDLIDCTRKGKAGGPYIMVGIKKENENNLV